MRTESTISARLHGFHPRTQASPDLLNAYIRCYAVYDGTSLKLGETSLHPVSRMKQLQTGSSGLLQLLAYTSNRRERLLHRKYRHLRIINEWHLLGPELLQEVEDWDFLNINLFTQLSRQYKE